MIRLIKSLFCTHEWVFWRNVYGDEINALNCRSLHVCTKCDLLKRGQRLVHQKCHPDAHDRIDGLDFCLRCGSKK